MQVSIYLLRKLEHEQASRIIQEYERSLVNEGLLGNTESFFLNRFGNALRNATGILLGMLMGAMALFIAFFILNVVLHVGG